MEAHDENWYTEDAQNATINKYNIWTNGQNIEV